MLGNTAVLVLDILSGSVLKSVAAHVAWLTSPKKAKLEIVNINFLKLNLLMLRIVVDVIFRPLLI